jgi:hypothetical protein
MADEDQTSSTTVEKLKKLKRKHATQHAHVTRFMSAINAFNGSTNIDEIEHHRDHLQEILKNLITLDEPIHDLLEDEEYAADAEKCEELVYGAKRAVRKADRIIKDRQEEAAQHTTGKSHITQSQPTLNQEIKLPTTKLEPFVGNIETWSSWRTAQTMQFQQPQLTWEEYRWKLFDACSPTCDLLFWQCFLAPTFP